MFHFTLPELVVIFIVALIVVGPKKLPDLARALGKAIGDLQRAMQGVREHIDTEIKTADKPPYQEGSEKGSRDRPPPQASGSPEKTEDEKT